MDPWRLLVVVLAVSVALPGAAGAQPSGSPVDVILLLDNSGSMKKNDPGSLMRSVTLDFARRLEQGTRLGIVAFDEDTDVVMGLTSVSEVNFLTAVEQGLQRIDYAGRYTDSPAGVERALYELRERGRAEARRVIVFLTDGIVDLGDPGRNLERARWLRDDLAPGARRLGIRIFGIAFTESADFQLIQSVARATDGEYFRILAASDIAGVFDGIALRLRQPSADGLPLPAAPSLPAARSRAVWWPWLAGALGAAGLATAGLVARRRRRPSVAASLRPLGAHADGRPLRLDRRLVRVGRADSNSLVIPQDTVSAEHALVEFRDGTFFLRDLRSANGTFLNGRRFSDTEAIRETALKHGDRIRFDAYEFEFVVHGLLDVPELAPEGGETAGVHRTVVRSSAPGDLARGPGALRPEPGPAGAGDQRGREAQTIVKPEKCPNHPWNATELCPQCRRAVCQHCLVQTGDGTLCVDCARDARGRTGTTE